MLRWHTLLLRFWLSDDDRNGEAPPLERIRGAGQPQVLAQRARSWANTMNRAGYDLLVMYDGSSPAAKLRTSIDRAKGRFMKAVAVSVSVAKGSAPTGLSSYLPTNASATVMEALRGCPNVGLYRDLGEADAMLACFTRAYDVDELGGAGGGRRGR